MPDRPTEVPHLTARPTSTTSALISVVVLGLTAGCTTTDGPTPTRGDAVTDGSTVLRPIGAATSAKERWTAVRPRSYRFTYLPSCFCGLVPGQVTVVDGKVTAWHGEPPSGSGDGPMTTADAPTIDTLLAEAARAEKEASGDVAISYDPATGIPVSATIDWIKDAIDDEMAWSVRDFVVLPTGSTSSTGPSSSA